ncbi:MAG TPA: ADP-ribosylglycohydrolase family protein [Vicinamibacterales bacterium]|nr:ADP-ribosylglycohydrolase family protein [Vicinamibacterales bacterium]HPW19250.1 ADP-ribosylglycohydrolase family protein [Vicinamibacterales bacterium]
MIGAITGDVAGSVYERTRPGAKAVPLLSSRSRFTDDSVLTIAVASAILHDEDYGSSIRKWARRYPYAGYEGRFKKWMSNDEAGPYGSYGNGSAMRVSPVGWAFESLDRVLAEAERTAGPTHNHPEGVKGAQAVASAVFLARTGSTAAEVEDFLADRFGYDCRGSLEKARREPHFDVTCQGTVPTAAAVAFEASGVEGAIRSAVALGGDADTIACIAGAIAEALHGGVPFDIQAGVFGRLDDTLRTVAVEFALKYRLSLAPSLRGPGRPARGSRGSGMRWKS